MKILKILSIFLLTIIISYLVLFKTSFGNILLGMMGISIDEYYQCLDENNKSLNKLKSHYYLKNNKDSIITLYYLPSFNSGYKISISTDSIIIYCINNLDNKCDTNIIKGIKHKYINNYFNKLKAITNIKMKSIRPKNLICVDGAYAVVELHNGNDFNVFEIWVSTYHDNRYNKIQNILASILTEFGYVSKQELINYGFKI